MFNIRFLNSTHYLSIESPLKVKVFPIAHNGRKGEGAAKKLACNDET